MSTDEFLVVRRPLRPAPRLRLRVLPGWPAWLAASWVLAGGLLRVTPGDLGESAVVGRLVVLGTLIGSVALHELAHAAVFLSAGVAVRVCVSPVLGLCEPDERAEPLAPGRELVMVLAGPAANLALGGAALVAVGRTSWSVVGIVPLGVLAVVNLVLGLVNLVPVLPLDGGRALMSLVRRVRGAGRRAGLEAALAAGSVAASTVMVAHGLVGGRGTPPLATATWAVIALTAVAFVAEPVRRMAAASGVARALLAVAAGVTAGVLMSLVVLLPVLG